MPELPEVESLRSFFDARISGLRFEQLQLLAFSALKTYDPPLDSLVGLTIDGVSRKGKYLSFDMRVADGEERHMVLHLSRGGWLRWSDELTPSKAKPGKGPMALRIKFSDGSGATVTEAGTEKRLAVWVVRDLDDIDHVHTLGPDPLKIEPAEMASLLKGQKGWIKKALTDQQVVAGVGNAYSDEALHMAKLSPYRGADKLTDDEALRLSEAVVQVLQEAVERSADTPVSGLKSEKKSNLRVHGRVGQKCATCGDTIREVSFSSKSLQYCPTCQTGGKPLADRRMSRLLK